MIATRQGKKAALAALAIRRATNEHREPFDNSKLHAGEPMYFPCIACGDDIRHNEDYLTRTRLCVECQALKDCGWLE
jgi:hypothetical protein